MEVRTSKRLKLFPGGDVSESESSSISGGVGLTEVFGDKNPQFQINEDFARRYEHNQKRAERHRLEEKYGSPKTEASVDNGGDSNSQEETESSEEDEDDRGILATGVLDEEYLETLRAIKEKDPRVYDKGTTFYTSNPSTDMQFDNLADKDKPLFLKDYHRMNLLNGHEVQDDGNEMPSYQEEQHRFKTALVQQIHAAAGGEDEAESSNAYKKEDDIFTIKKPAVLDQPKATISADDVDQADQDPDGFLARFMETKAWVPSDATKLHPFESDDEEEDRKAEEFEDAYNMRFETPKVTNEKITTHSRDTASKYSIRQEPETKRKRAREREKVNKNEARAIQAKEKAMLRKLRMEEAGQKLNKIRDAAGLEGTAINLQEWSNFLTEDWDTVKWEAKMGGEFGENYYSVKEKAMGEEVRREGVSRPQWDSDIDITDILPSFVTEDKSMLVISDEEADSHDDTKGAKASTKKKVRRKQEGRMQRRKLQQLVDEKVDFEVALNGTGSNAAGSFQYRETSPLSFGLTTQDILTASDSQLNRFAGLKKLATFREASRRQKDMKRLGKKGRLRQWRRDTFGSEQRERQTLQDIVLDAHTAQNRETDGHSDPVSTNARVTRKHEGHTEQHPKKKKRRLTSRSSD